MSKRRHNFGTKRFKEKSLFIFHARIALKSLILLFVRLIARGARIGKTHTDRHTDRQTDRTSTVTLAHARRGLTSTVTLAHARRGLIIIISSLLYLLYLRLYLYISGCIIKLYLLSQAVFIIISPVLHNFDTNSAP